MATHEADRQVSDEEQRLWKRYKAAIERSQYDRISVTEVAVNEVGLHETRSRQIVSTWENEGLVISGAADSYDMAMLTEYGRQVDEIHSIY